MMNVQSCCFANLNLLLFCRSCCCRRRRCLSSLLLSAPPPGVQGLCRSDWIMSHNRLQNCQVFFSESVKKSVKRGVRVLRARSAQASHAQRACVARRFLASLPSLALCFQPRTGYFVWLLARSWIRKNTDCFAVYSHNKIQFSLLFIERHCFLISTALPAVQCIHVIPSVLSPGMCWVAGKSIVADLQAHGISSIY